MTSFDVIPNSSIGYDIYPDRWKVLGLLGRGTFTKVIRALDKHTNQHVAIKISSLNKEAEGNAYYEIDILNKICESDKEDKYAVIKYELYFKEASTKHICIVMPELRMTLHQYIKGYRNLPNYNVRDITNQLISVVSYLHDQLHIIHTDIKPPNILIEPCSMRIRLIDFNLSMCIDNAGEPLTGIITTIFYRAPEVALESEWSYPVDIWSIGCVLFELYTGQALFPVLNEEILLTYICTVLGPMPDQEKYKNTKQTRYDKLNVIKDTKLLSIIKQCLVYNSVDRATIGTLATQIEY